MREVARGGRGTSLEGYRAGRVVGLTAAFGKRYDAAPMVGNRVSHYRILERLGWGGMGVVYKTEDTKRRRFVTLEFLRENVATDPAALARFRHEAQAVQPPPSPRTEPRPEDRRFNSGTF